MNVCFFFFFQAEDGIRDLYVTGVQTCALPIWKYRDDLYADVAGRSPCRHQQQGARRIESSQIILPALRTDRLRHEGAAQRLHEVADAGEPVNRVEVDLLHSSMLVVQCISVCRVTWARYPITFASRTGRFSASRANRRSDKSRVSKRPSKMSSAMARPMTGACCMP